MLTGATYRKELIPIRGKIIVSLVKIKLNVCRFAAKM